MKLRFPKPFSTDKLRDLLAVADELTAVLKFPYGEQVTERDFWRAAFQARHDTGLPYAQLFALPWRAIQPDGRLNIECRFSRETMIAIGHIVSTDRPLAFDLPETGYDARNRLRLIRVFAAGWDGKDGGA